jgi:tetratricopeptide (TPR) repeat protein
VARICQLAQGMPLAILLAAAWVPTLGTAEIAAEMERSLDFLAADWRDEPERHHSMSAVFDAMWWMLTEEERDVFARLSVFRGGFTREAAEAVTGADLRTLGSLIRKSLLQRDRGGRYEIHELLRQYAETKLEEQPAGKKRALDLHCAVFVEFMQFWDVGPQKMELKTFLSDLDNIRAAWRHALTKRRARDVLSLLHGLYGSYGAWSIQEAIDLSARAMAMLRSTTPALDHEGKVVLGMALATQGHFRLLSGDEDRGGELICESLAILSELDPRRELAFCLNAAIAHGVVSDPAERNRFLTQALAISKDVGDYRQMLWATNLRARQALVDGDIRAAEKGFHQVLTLSRQLHSQSWIGGALVYLGHAAFARRQYGRAYEYYAQGLAASKAIGQGFFFGRVHQHLGDAALALSEYGTARKHYAEALTSYRDIGVIWHVGPAGWGGSYGVPVTLQALGDVALVMGDVDLAIQHYRQALESVLDHPSLEPHLHLLLGPARLYAQTGDSERAAELVALARHHPANVEETRSKAGELLGRLRSDLPPEAYAAAVARGRARDLETTVRELLVELEGERVLQEPQQDE